MVLPPPQGELGFNASVASTEISPARSPPGRAMHRRCLTATGNAKSHHEPGETCSPHDIPEGSNGKEFGQKFILFQKLPSNAGVISPFSVIWKKCL